MNQIGDALRQSVPFVRTLGLEIEEIDEKRAVLRLPDDPALHNHVGGPHAGAMFSLGESATGAIVLASFAGLLGTHTPLAYDAQIRYLKLACGPVTAEATLAVPADEVRATVQAEGKARFPVEVTIREESGMTTGEMSATWALRPHG